MSSESDSDYRADEDPGRGGGSDSDGSEYRYREEDDPTSSKKSKTNGPKGKGQRQGNSAKRGPGTSGQTHRVLEEMSFDEAVEILEHIHESLAQSQSQSRRKRKPDKVSAKNWTRVVVAFEKESKNGINQETIIGNIDLITNTLSPIPATYACRLLLTLLPKQDIVPTKSIRQIVNYMTAKPKIKGKERLKGYMLQYLYGLYEYNLLDENCFYTPYIFGRLFSLQQQDAFVSSACFFLKKICHKHLIQRSYVLDILDNLVRPHTKAAAKSLLHLLRYFKLLRPDLVPNEVFRMQLVSKSRVIQLKPNFRTQLFDAKARLTGADNGEYALGQGGVDTMELVTNILNVGLSNRFCFREFPLHMHNDVKDPQRWTDLHKRDFMRCALKETDTLPLLAKDEAAMDCFCSFLYQIFAHKFDNYDTKEHECYIFILHRCLQLTRLLGQGLDVVNEWLLEFITHWDGYLFKGYIFELLKFMNPISIKKNPIVFAKLREIFLYMDDISRLRVFEVLGALMISWGKMHFIKPDTALINELGEESDNEENGPVEMSSNESGPIFKTEDLEEYLDFINKLVTEIAGMNGHKNEAFLIICCNTYVKMIKEYRKIIQAKPEVQICIVPPITLWYMVVLCDSVNAFDAFAEIFRWFSRSLIKKPTTNIAVLDWKSKVMPSFQHFIHMPGTDDWESNNVFASLFRSELDFLGSLHDENVAFPDEFDKLLSSINSFSINSSSAKVILNDPSSEVPIVENLNIQRAEQLMPNLLHFLQHRNLSDLTVSQAP